MTDWLASFSQLEKRKYTRAVKNSQFHLQHLHRLAGCSHIFVMFDRICRAAQQQDNNMAAWVTDADQLISREEHTPALYYR